MSGEIATWFNGWDRILSIVQSALFFFVFIIVLMRVSGKRTSGQMNNFDWIVVVAVGSLAAGGILLKEVSVADAAAAMLVLTLLQWVTTWLVSRYEWFACFIKPPPRLLLDSGELLDHAMRDERISDAEIRTELRRKGLTSFESVNWVVLETDGTLTVIPRQDLDISDAEIMDNVRRGPN